MPLKLKNAASLSPRALEDVEAVGITIPVFPYLQTAEKLTFAQFGEDANSPIFLLRAFSIFSRWRCPPADQVSFETLAAANLESDELSAIGEAVRRLFAAAREDEPEKKAKVAAQTNSTT